MTFPERFANLPEYAFPRLRTLLDAHAPGGDVLHMSLGEPKHPFPDWVGPMLAEHSADFGRYPVNEGTPELLDALTDWHKRRYGLAIDGQNQLMVLNGSREGLFNAVLALSAEDRNGAPVVLMPNPFYQVYAVGAAAAGATAQFLPARQDNGFLPDFQSVPAEILDRTTVAFICTPSNPQGAIASEAYLKDLIALAEKHGFRVFSDECYSEIYEGDPPPSALKVASDMGADPERVVVFNSLSKRSNLPGLRSGFVASGPDNIRAIRRLRSYAGAPVPLPVQHVSARLWSDEAHVAQNRALYAEKYEIARQIFGDIDGIELPRAGFFLWLPVDDDEAATVKIWTKTGIRVLPGSYLSRDTADGNPGKTYIRVAMVAPKQETQRGLEQIRDCLFV